MINLLHVSANQYTGINPSEHTCKIWIELAKGFDNYYVFARSKTNSFEKFQSNNINLILIPKIINRSSIFIITSFLLLFYVKKLKITHILCQSAIFGGLACIFAKKRFGIPVMIEIHGEEYFRILNTKNLVVKLIAKILVKIYKSADKIRSLNKFMTAKLEKHNIIKNVVEIFPRVNLELFKEIKEDYKIENNILKLVSVGRFVNAKNYENLIIYLKKSGVEFRLTLIGGGVLKDKYIKTIQKLNIEKNVILIDWIEQKDLIKTVIENDIYIQSSISEGMPRAIIEAMALQLPIISTNVGSIEGVIENEVNGLLVTPDEKEIVEAINRMSNSEQFRIKLAKQARKDVLDKYEWNSVFNKYRDEIITMGCK